MFLVALEWEGWDTPELGVGVASFDKLAKRRVRRLLGGVAAVALLAGMSGSANAISVKEAVTVALEANPEIGEAIANREAREFELRQAHGLYLPQVDLEARTGTQRLDSPGTRAGTTREDGVIPSPLLDDDDTYFNRREASVVVQQLLFDGFNRRGERHHQAARVDSAGHRVYERSNAIALNTIREYLEYGLRREVVQFAKDNVAYHEVVLSALKEGAAAEAISIADRQQAEERIYAARARLVEANQDLNSAGIRFFKLVGKPLDVFEGVPAVTGALPRNLDEAIGIGRQNNPNINIAKADLDAARALIKQARSEYFPKLSLELRGRTGEDLEAVRNTEKELRAELVMRWNLFKGRIDSYNIQEQVRRSDEERYGLRKAHREVEEAVRLSWEVRLQQARRLAQVQDQLAATNQLIESYTEQFKVGDRSLLDLLNTQNTRFNTQVTVATARNALTLAEYRVLAANGTLLDVLHVKPPEQSDAYARPEERVPDTPEGETDRRYEPRRTHWWRRSTTTSVK